MDAGMLMTFSPSDAWTDTQRHLPAVSMSLKKSQFSMTQKKAEPDHEVEIRWQ